MEKVLYLIMILSIIIFVIAIILIFIISKSKKIFSLLCKINESELLINKKLKDKLELLIRAINIIERELKIDSKILGEVKKIKVEKINSISLCTTLDDAFKEVEDIKDDYKELSKTKSFDGIIQDIEDINVYLDGAKTFYNKYANIYNCYVKKFPNNLIAKVRRCNIKALYNSGSFENDNLKIDFNSI